CHGMTVCQKPITSLRSNCGQAASEISSRSNPAGVSRRAAMNFWPGSIGCSVMWQIPCGLATWYPVDCCLVGAAVLMLLPPWSGFGFWIVDFGFQIANPKSAIQNGISLYHKRPRIRTTFADAELYRTGAFGAVPFVAQP